MKGEGATNRRYDLDWLRVIAFAILIFFHTGMGFTSYDWHVKNYESSPFLDELIRFLHQWRMPLLFFISGAAVWFALEKYGTWHYLGERQKRLLWPLIFGMLVVIPPQVYCERIYQRQGYASFFDFYPTIFTAGSYPQGNLSWHHLWYIPYIWAYSMMTLPLFAWLRSPSGRLAIVGFQNLLKRPLALYFIFLPAALTEIVLRPYFPGDSCNLISDWANFTHKLTFFIIGFALASGLELAEVICRGRWQYLAAAVISLIGLEYVWHAQVQMPSALYRCLSNFEIWMWILAALGFGRRYLNANSSALRYATSAVYPFYILHQTVIVILLLPLVYVDLGLWTKYTLVLTGTVLVTWGLYEGLISRVNILRVSFGLKARKSSSSLGNVPGSADLPGGPGQQAAVRINSGPLGTSLLIAAALALATNAGATGKLTPVEIPGPSLANNLLRVATIQPAAVYLPPSYFQSQKRYPVIYLLPNFDTGVWRYTAGSYQEFRLQPAVDGLIAAGRMPELIVLIPNAAHFLGSSWYRNSKLTGNWEDFITRDIVGYVDSHFRTIARRDARGLAGHGVGGTGALELGLKHSDLFGGVYAMSPAVMAGEDLAHLTEGGEKQAEPWRRLVGEWSTLNEADAARAFRLYTQARLNSSSSSDLFDILRISCAAASGTSISQFPYIDYPFPESHDAAARSAYWAEILGNWKGKVQAYLSRADRLKLITIEYGRRGDYDFIVRGAQHVSQVMNELNVSNTLSASEGNHDGTLGRRLREGMLPTLGNALKTE
jgi:glucans biosynthesis protein C